MFVRTPGPGTDGIWGTSDDDYGDLRPQVFSPVADAGNNNAQGLLGIDTDLGGGNRFLDIPIAPDTGMGTAPIVDMGAYEAVPAFSVNAGGPYYVLPGQNITLNGRGFSPATGGVTYGWDWMGGGNFDDATISNPVFSTANWQGPSTMTLRLRVTDSTSASTIATTTLRILPAIYVDDSAPGANNGSSWTNAFTSLQAALAAAATGQEIRVAQGTYKPTTSTDRTISFQLKEGVSVLGGYAGVGTSNPDAHNPATYLTTLSGDIGAPGINTDNSHHVVVGSNMITAILDGFTISGGNANGAFPYNCGGGMYISSGSPIVRNCSFIGNTGGYGGGGMYNSSSSTSLLNCTFANNTIASYGGGIFNDAYSTTTLTNCTFSGNTASSYGGGMFNYASSPTVTSGAFSGNMGSNGGGMFNYSSIATVSDTAFTANTAFSGGGGMYNYSSSSANLSHCTFTGNLAFVGGGGMYNNSSSPGLSDCTFDANSGSTSDGGGVYNTFSAPTVTNCSFTRNSTVGTGTSGRGAGMFNNSSSPTLTNCTFSANIANTADGGGLYNNSSLPLLTNCTFSVNSATGAGRGGGVFNSSSSPTLTNCTITGNSASSGAGVYNDLAASAPTLSACTFSGNATTGSAGYGGGVYNNSSSPSLTNCAFIANSAAYGGGMYSNASAALALTSCTFNGNLASSNGGGVYNNSSPSTLTNCVFAGNAVTGASGSGGAIYNASSAQKLTNSTLSANTAYSGGAVYSSSSSPVIANSILWNNPTTSGAQIAQSGGSTTAYYSDIQQTGLYPGKENLNSDPRFVRNPGSGPDNQWGTTDDDYGDLRLQANSPGIDAGVNSVVPVAVTTDRNGGPRMIDYPGVQAPEALVDLGAYELAPSLPLGGGMGGEGSVNFYVGLTNVQSLVRIWTDSTPSGDPRYCYDSRQNGACILSGGMGDDTITMDFSAGSITPALFSFDGGLGTDTLILTGLTTGQRILVQPGQVAIDGTTIVLASTENVIIDAPANSSIRLGALNLSSKVSVPAGKHLVFNSGSLSISGAGLLDLSDNDLIVSSGDLSQITAWLKQGRTDSSATRWQGATGIVSSQASKPANFDLGLAVMRNGTPSHPLITLFDGQAVDGNCVLVKYTRNGDADLNGRIDSDDYFQIDRGFLTANTGYQNGDFDYNGAAINADDYFLIDLAAMRQPAT